MAKRPLSFAEKLQKTVDKANKRAAENQRLYVAACRRAGVEVGQPVDIMALIGKDKK